MKRYLTAVLALTRAYIKRFFRDKTAMFFTFLFPLLFLFVFGSLYSNSNGGVNFNVAILNQSDSEFAKKFAKQLGETEILTVNEGISTFESAKELMGRGEVDSIIELPENFGELNATNQPSGSVSVYYSEASPQAGQTLAAVLDGVLDDINRELGQPEAPLTVTQKATETTNLTQFDYVFAGLLGFSILSLGLFGLANQMPAEKQRGMLAAIVGFELEVLAWRETLKLSQNKPADERERVAAGLESEGSPAIAQLMRTLAK